MPFEVLMEHVAGLGPDEWELPLGVLAERWGEPAARISDAIDALKVVRGEPSYISVRPMPAASGMTMGSAGNSGGMSGCGPGGGAGTGGASGGAGIVGPHLGGATLPR